jgi:hypothetical protein
VIDEFITFAKREIACGGPEPEIEPIVYLTRNQTEVEKVWAAGVYCSHHCVPSAMVVWKQWRPEQLVGESNDYSRGCLEEWLAEHWDALPVRNEMRSHRMIEKRARCLADFAQYAVGETWRVGDYDEVWDDSIGSVKYFGRYVAIKYMEFLRRMVRPELILTDVRIASGAWSVREGLAKLFPSHEAILANRSDNSHKAIDLAEACANELIIECVKRDLILSHFDTQVLLCEFKQWQRGTFYPGASHDEEMEFAKRVEADFSIPEFWEIRRTIFPTTVLGEIGGWHGQRKGMQ